MSKCRSVIMSASCLVLLLSVTALFAQYQYECVADGKCKLPTEWKCWGQCSGTCSGSNKEYLGTNRFDLQSPGPCKSATSAFIYCWNQYDCTSNENKSQTCQF